MTDRTLIRGGIVLTQDPNLGELASADVLIEDGAIVDVGPNLSADGARVIDAPRISLGRVTMVSTSSMTAPPRKSIFILRTTKAKPSMPA